MLISPHIHDLATFTVLVYKQITRHYPDISGGLAVLKIKSLSVSLITSLLHITSALSVTKASCLLSDFQQGFLC